MVKTPGASIRSRSGRTAASISVSLAPRRSGARQFVRHNRLENPLAAVALDHGARSLVTLDDALPRAGKARQIQVAAQDLEISMNSDAAQFESGVASQAPVGLLGLGQREGHVAIDRIRERFAASR